ncbi:hypothetical protein ACFYMB_01385 [Micromonospora haikouensis]|uniref:hypothetical protein n=1 Tax=Micromonospora haikouensis TaxID=686309 RepID=UPI0034286040
MPRALLGIVFGILLILVGVALAADYRGLATRHIELSMRTVRPISPFKRKGWMGEELVRRRSRFVVFDRFFGGVMVFLGMVALIVGGNLLI